MGKGHDALGLDPDRGEQDVTDDLVALDRDEREVWAGGLAKRVFEIGLAWASESGFICPPNRRTV